MARKRSTPASLAWHYLHGLMMGTADVVPGVSGGTVALIVGIYRRLIDSIRNFVSAPLALARGRGGEAVGSLRAVEWVLVLPLAAGILTALVVGARLIPGILEQYPVHSRALFFGLIAASLALPWRRIERHRRRLYLAMAVAAVVAFLLVGFPPREVVSPPLPVVFAAASIAICAMILPGVSGAFLLLVMGMYEVTLRALDGRDWAYIFVFAAGAIVGIGLFAKLLGYLLDRWHDLTMAALVGLMVGSLRALWPYQDADRALLAPPMDGSVLGVLLIAVLGFALVAGVIAYAARLEGEVVDTTADHEVRPR
jgi:putative membrane protein